MSGFGYVVLGVFAGGCTALAIAGVYKLTGAGFLDHDVERTEAEFDQQAHVLLELGAWLLGFAVVLAWSLP